MTKNRPIPPQHPVATVWQPVAAPERKLDRKKPGRNPETFEDDIGDLTICDDPWRIQNNVSKQSAYASLFAQIKPGQAIKCKPERSGCTGQALRKHLERTGKDKTHCVSVVKDYGDGMGRVWLLLRDDKRTKGAA